ncbi:hypothetical protein [Natrinema marinum]|uniref:hypothetical protein n=1 Tax=Natrinema marinum TaxID=2961598 RepID=UPI0020C89FE0|nr:hypothetical protein [Natrinema marinum]
MISRENTVIAVGAVLSVVVLLVGAAIGLEGPLFGAIVLVGIPILGPQLYLAATGDVEVPPETRIRISVLVSIVLLSGFTVTGTGRERTIVRTVVFGLFVALLGYEFASGYRSRSGGQ